MSAGGRPRPIWVAGNWKLNLPRPLALALAERLAAAWPSLAPLSGMVAPAFPALEAVGRALAGSGLALAAQSSAAHPAGAFTGEVSAPHLAAVGCTYVLVGHSERRQLFGEDLPGTRARLALAREHGLVPVLCVGESLAEREGGRTSEVLAAMCDAALGDAPPPGDDALILAYEPVWAIGTGLTASPEVAQATHQALRAHLASRFGAARAAAWPILYGGSVKAESAGALVAQADIDGVLVGGAALQADTFLAIARAVRATM